MKVGYKSLRKDYITAVCLKQVFFVLFCRRILSKSFSVGSSKILTQCGASFLPRVWKTSS